MALTGRAPLLALAGVVPVALAPGWATLLGWALLVLLLVAADVALAGSPRGLRLRRESSAAVRLGESAAARLVVANEGPRRVRGLLRDGWPPSAGDAVPRHAIDVPAGQERTVTTTLRPTRRGDRRTERVTVRSLGPLGLAARQASLPTPGVLRVLPAFDSRRHLPAKLARLRELDGQASVRVRGQGTEFDSLRDYVDGDDVRSIDWRASARRQAPVKLVVRTWRPERDRRVLLVLDTSRTAAARVGDAPRLDAAMDAALLLAALAARAGDRVDLLAVDTETHANLTTSNTRGLPRLQAALAPLQPALVETDFGRVASEVLALERKRALVVLFTTLDAGAVGEGLLPVLPTLVSRHRVVVAAVHDPALEAYAGGRGGVGALHVAAAAERGLAELRRVRAALVRYGVTVIDAPAETFASQVADTYLDLKAAGRL